MMVWAKLALSPLLPGYNVLGFISLEAIPLVAVGGRVSPITTAINYILFYIVEGSLIFIQHNKFKILKLNISLLMKKLVFLKLIFL